MGAFFMAKVRLVCKVDGCEKKSHGIGLCQQHYHRFKIFGDFNVKEKPRGTPIERFWKFVEKSNGCWSWNGNKSNGYGRFAVGAKKEGYFLAHRFSWELHNNAKIPDGMFVMHKCDNPECTNPDHLMLGTPKENTQDMIAKGRKITVAPVGAGNGKSVLNEEKVRFIRSSDLSHAALARLLDVSTGCVRGVRIGRTWSHVPNINEIT
jgi:hypothetical protein